MKVYGYVRVNTEGDHQRNGRKAEFLTFESEQLRNDVMYCDYSDSFDSIAVEDRYDEEKDQFYEHDLRCDYEGEPKLTKEEFMNELQKSEDVNLDVFGHIAVSEGRIQYEPFCIEIDVTFRTKGAYMGYLSLEDMKKVGDIK